MPRLIMLSARMVRAIHGATDIHAMGLADFSARDFSATVRAAREARIVSECPDGLDVYWWDFAAHGVPVTVYYLAASEWDVLDRLGVAEVMRS